MGKNKKETSSLHRRAVLLKGGAAGIAGLAGVSTAAKSAEQSYDYPVKTPPTPKIKPRNISPVTGRWTQLGDMPFPTQEIYPSPFWTKKIADQQKTKALMAQRFNIIVNAGGITGRRGGIFEATERTTVYEPISDLWTPGPALPEPFHHLHLVAHNGFLYALGGFTTLNRRNEPDNNGWRMSDDVLRLDSIDGRWEYVSRLPSPQAEAVCVSLNGFIHVAGGRSPVGSMNSIWTDHIDTDRHYVYDSRDNKWFKLASMNVARNSAAGTTVGGIFYVIGGRQVNGGNLSVVEAYDPLSDRWQIMHPMPQAQAGLAAAAIDDTIFVFGGEYFDNGGGVYRKTWAYDTREDKWRSADPMPRPRHGLGAVSMNNAIYVMGGASQAGGNATSAVLERFAPF